MQPRDTEKQSWNDKKCKDLIPVCGVWFQGHCIALHLSTSRKYHSASKKPNYLSLQMNT